MAASTVTANSGSGGAAFAVDTISGVTYPITKLAVGGANSADLVTASAPLPVDASGVTLSVSGAVSIASAVTVNSHAVTNAGTFAVQASQEGAWAVSVTGGLSVISITAASTIKASISGGLSIISITAASTIAASISGGLSVVSLSGGVVTVNPGAAQTSIGGVDIVRVAIFSAGGAQVNAFGGSGGTSTTDRSQGAAGAVAGTPIMGLAYDATLSNLSVGEVGIPFVTLGRKLKVDASGDTLSVAGAVSITGGISIVSLTAASTVKASLTGSSAPVLNSINAAMSAIASSLVISAQSANGAVRMQMIGMEARLTEPTAQGSTGNAVRPIASGLGKQITLPYAIPTSTWAFACTVGGITGTTVETAHAAAGSGVRAYVTGLQAVNADSVTGVEVRILDGIAGSVLWRGYAYQGGGGVSARFDPPIRGSANTVMATGIGAAATGGVFINLQGYLAAE